MGKRLLAAYELAQQRVISSRYREERDAQEKREKNEREEVDALPDFVDSWERPDKGKSAPTTIEEGGGSRLYTKSEIEEKQTVVYKQNEEKLKDSLYMTPVQEKQTVNFSEKPMELHWYGHFTSYSGFSRQNRAMAFGLSNRNCIVKVDIQECALEVNESTQNELKLLASREISPSAPKVYGATVPLRLAHGGKKILYTMMETSETLHEGYVGRINLYDEIWVPTNNGKDLFIKNGVRPPIKVMPLGVDTLRYHPNAKKLKFGFGLKDFVFLSVFKWGYRKGYDILLKAFMEEFSADDDVSLLIASRTDVNHNPKIIAEDFKNIRNSVLKDDSDLPHIALYDKIIKEKDMPGLYAAADAFVLISRGEGFCTLPTARIKTPNGIREIQDIKVGDKVFSHTGKVKSVTNVFARDYDGEIIDIKSIGRSNQKLTLTPNHPVRVVSFKNVSSTTKLKYLHCLKYDKNKDNIYFDCLDHYNSKSNTIKMEWKEAKDIEVGDYLFYPKMNHDASCKWIVNGKILLDKIDDFSRFVIENDKIYKRGNNQYSKNFKSSLVFEKTELPFDEGFLKLMGYFVSEGTCSKNEVIFSFHRDELEYHNEVISLMKFYFGDITFKVVPHKVKKSARIVFQSIIASTLFAFLFGKGARNKKLKPFMFALTPDFQYSFLHGLFNGDGYYSPNYKASLSTSSVNLANDIFDMLFSLRIKSTIKERILKDKLYYSVDVSNIKDSNKFLSKVMESNCKQDEGRNSDCYFQYNDFQLLPVRTIVCKKYNGMVHNIGVEEDNSYICENIAVHNCIPYIEAAATGLPVIGSNCSGQTDFLSHDNSFLVDPESYSKAKINGNLSKLATHCGFYEEQMFPDFGRDSIEKTKEHMRNVYENYQEAQIKAAILSQRVRENYTWDIAIDRVYNRLKEIQQGV